jgi:hypothetical protein
MRVPHPGTGPKQNPETGFNFLFRCFDLTITQWVRTNFNNKLLVLNDLIYMIDWDQVVKIAHQFF